MLDPLGERQRVLRDVGQVDVDLVDAAILDQRLMWMVPLVYLIVKGAGAVSLDRLLVTMSMKNGWRARPMMQAAQ